jgi:hypothetical protein
LTSRLIDKVEGLHLRLQSLVLCDHTMIAGLDKGDASSPRRSEANGA